MEPAAADAFEVPTTAYVPAPLEVPERRFAIPWQWWDAVVVFVAWFVVQSAALSVAPIRFGEDAGDADVAAAVLLGVVTLTGTCLGWVAVRGARSEVPGALRRLVGVKTPTLADVGRGVAWGVGGFVVVQGVLGVLIAVVVEQLGREVPAVQETVQAAARAEGTAVPIVLAVGVVLLGPLAEELLYRGLLYQALARDLPAWPAFGLSGLAFGLSHGELFVVALTFPLGMLLAWTMRRYGTLVVPVVAHMVFNLISYVLITRVDAGAL